MLHGVGGADLPTPAFQTLARWLGENFQVVSLDDLLAASDPTDLVALTFDDGLRNNATLAAPVLRSLGLPATFYVCSGLIGTDRWLWTHEVRARLRRGGEAVDAELAGTWDRPRGERIDARVEWLKSLPTERRLACEADLRAATPDFEPTPAERAASDIMTWDELRGLDANLITIGSHTHEHPMLPTLAPERRTAEIVGSRDVLATALGRPVHHFCYPNGAQDETVVRAVRAAYRSAVTTEPGFVRAGDDPHRLARVAVTPHLPLLSWRFHRPTA